MNGSALITYVCLGSVSLKFPIVVQTVCENYKNVEKDHNLLSKKKIQMLSSG